LSEEDRRIIELLKTFFKTATPQEQTELMKRLKEEVPDFYEGLMEKLKEGKQ